MVNGVRLPFVEGVKAQAAVRFPRLVDALRPAVRRTRRIFYRGGRVECPCCRGSYRKFLPFHGRPAALCPGCRCSERHRLLWLFLEREFDLAGRAPISVLHFAPEPVLERRLSELHGVHYLSTDLNPDAAMVAADITDLPFEDERFGLILCSHVLEHVERDEVAMRELRRVLAPGGTALLMHPVDDGRERTYEDWSLSSPHQRRQAFLQEDHVRLYGRDLEDRLEAAGFEVAVRRYLDQLGDEEQRRYGLRSPAPVIPTVRGDDIYLCRRSG